MIEKRAPGAQKVEMEQACATCQRIEEKYDDTVFNLCFYCPECCICHGCEETACRGDCGDLSICWACERVEDETGLSTEDIGFYCPRCNCCFGCFNGGCKGCNFEDYDDVALRIDIMADNLKFQHRNGGLTPQNTAAVAQLSAVQ